MDGISGHDIWSRCCTGNINNDSLCLGCKAHKRITKEKVMAVLFLSYILSAIFSAAEGIREAIFWKYSANLLATKDNKQLHKFFLIVRACYGIAITFLIYLHSASPITTVLFCISSMLAFPYIHDGFYYWKRNQLDPGTYPKTFHDMSNTSLAWTDKFFTAEARIVMLANSLAILVIAIVYQHNKIFYNLW